MKGEEEFTTASRPRHLIQNYLDASAEVGDVPPTVCIRHGRHVPCRRSETDCLLSSHPAVVSLVDAYQRDTDGVRYDFEHVAKSWIYLMKREGNW